MGAPDIVKDILSTAVYAPSGDNAQPWRFVVTEDSVSVFNIPDRDETLYNFRQRGSYVGHGALIENIRIAAEHYGYATSIMLFPGEPLCVATIKLTKTVPNEMSLYDHIRIRSTNRKRYKREPLTAEEYTDLRNTLSGFPGVQLAFTDTQAHIEALAHAISTNERVLMEHRGLHDFLFSMIRWSTEEEKQKPGLYIKTMEFPLPMQIVMRYVISHWTILDFLNKFGFSKMVPKQSSGEYRASGAMGSVIISGLDDRFFIEAGRVFQRMWLTASQKGLSVQPVTAIPYLMQRIEEGEAAMFSPEHQQLIRDAHRIQSDAFLLKEGQRIAMLFRIGRGDPPSAPSYKLPPIIDVRLS